MNLWKKSIISQEENDEEGRRSTPFQLHQMAMLRNGIPYTAHQWMDVHRLVSINNLTTYLMY